MKNAKWFIGGIGGLILVYLLITNGDAVEKLLRTFADSSIKGVAVLQGRPNVQGVT